MRMLRSRTMSDDLCILIHVWNTNYVQIIWYAGIKSLSLVILYL